MSDNINLIPWDKFKHQIENTHDIEELSKLTDKLKAYKILAEQSKQSAEVQTKITNYLYRAQRKQGEWLSNNIKTGQRSDLSHHSTGLKQLGITRDESSKLQKLAQIPDEKFETILNNAEAEVKKVTKNMLVNVGKEIDRAERKQELMKKGDKVITPEDVLLFSLDFRDVPIDENSIDLILTDPPYPKEYIGLWNDLAEYAEASLKPSGFLVAYSGQYNLPEVISRLSERLKYYWCFCLEHKGKSQIVNGVNVMCQWKPVLIFQKPPFKKFELTKPDYIISEDREKAGHDWQQSESGVCKLIELFSKENDIILDPFMGAGTIPYCAYKMNRRPIGIEIDKDTFKIAKGRFND